MERRTNTVLKRIAKYALRIILSALALYFVFTKINLQELKTAVSGLSWGYFLLAIVMFNIAKLVAAQRAWHLYEAAGVTLPTFYNIQLAYIGSFYNLFLPGSVGGDGYKVFLLKQHHSVSTKKLIVASLLDRLSGLVLLSMLGLLLATQSTFTPKDALFYLIVFGGFIMAIPVFYIGVKLFFPAFTGKVSIVSLLSLGVQAGQVLTAYLLLQALGIHNYLYDYLTLFMGATIAAVIPAFLGGLGGREVGFITLNAWLFGTATVADNSLGTALTLLFFSVLAISSFIGLYFTFTIRADSRK